MRLFFLGLLVSGFALAVPYNYHGNFRVEKADPGCEQLFSSGNQLVSLVFAGSSGLTAVAHFSNAVSGGFFDNFSIVGAYDGSNLSFDKDETFGGGTYQIHMDGIISADMLLLSIDVKGSFSGAPACEAKAEYSAFP